MNTPEHKLVETAERLIESAEDRRRRLNRERQARWRARLRQKEELRAASSARGRLVRASRSPDESDVRAVSSLVKIGKSTHQSSRLAASEAERPAKHAAKTSKIPPSCPARRRAFVCDS